MAKRNRVGKRMPGIFGIMDDIDKVLETNLFEIGFTFKKKPRKTPEQKAAGKAAEISENVAKLEREAHAARAEATIERSKERVKAEKAEAKREINEAKARQKEAERKAKHEVEITASRGKAAETRLVRARAEPKISRSRAPRITPKTPRLRR